MAILLWRKLVSAKKSTRKGFLGKTDLFCGGPRRGGVGDQFMKKLARSRNHRRYIRIRVQQFQGRGAEGALRGFQVEEGITALTREQCRAVRDERRKTGNTFAAHARPI